MEGREKRNSPPLSPSTPLYAPAICLCTVNVMLNLSNKKFTHLRKQRLRNVVQRSPDEFTAELRDSRRCANPVRGLIAGRRRGGLRMFTSPL